MSYLVVIVSAETVHAKPYPTLARAVGLVRKQPPNTRWHILKKRVRGGNYPWFPLGEEDVMLLDRLLSARNLKEIPCHSESK